MDSVSSEQRSWNMSRIKAKDTKIEVLVRQYLFSKGYRFRKNDKRYPGKPDVVLPKYKTVIFVNGCFWHMHKNCKYGRIPKSNVDYWKLKLERNVQNDKKHYKELEKEGWRVIVLWECELKKDFDAIMEKTIESFDPL
ncbi:DNA mismatch endonuclease Vsr [Clostridiales Family XIII bacterium RF-744-FAT-WT-3]|uniref:Very short patch repair endonuclease n=1 Tax=Baileyella intestinalis TaxID=2606709 RepID=A0A6A8M8M9_9FIRM|nr:very short patch repair endonuclease [Baileyella intestinalis]MST69702.1 DNA mismatch endonuclease Vsr [Baileyella intestinalis]